MRLAYFHAIWTSRNESLWDHQEVPAYTLYRNKLKSIFNYRYNKAQEQNETENFKLNYGVDKICRIVNDTIELGTLTQNSQPSQSKRKNTQLHNSQLQPNKKHKTQPTHLNT